MTTPKGPPDERVRRELLRRLLALPIQTPVMDLVNLAHDIREPELSLFAKTLKAHEERFAKVEKELTDLKNVVALKRVQSQPVKREGPLGQYLGGM